MEFGAGERAPCQFCGCAMQECRDKPIVELIGHRRPRSVYVGVLVMRLRASDQTHIPHGDPYWRFNRNTKEPSLSRGACRTTVLFGSEVRSAGTTPHPDGTVTLVVN